MNDWVPKQQDWITVGYTDFRKRRKRKHSKALFEKHVKKAYDERGIHLNMVSSAPRIFMELFWQCEVLKDWCFELTRLIANQSAQTVVDKRKNLEFIKEIQQLAERADAIFLGENDVD